MSEIESLRRETETSKKRSWFRHIPLLLFVIVCITLIVVPIVKNYQHEREVHAAEELVQKTREMYCTEFPDVLISRLKQEKYPFVKQINVEISVYMEQKWYDGVSWYNFERPCTVTITASDQFNSYSDREIYNLMKDIYDTAFLTWILYDHPDKRGLAENNADYENTLKKGYGYYSPQGELRLYIHAGNNKYEYSSRVSDYYVLNDKDHFLRDERSQNYRTPAEQSPGPSAGTHGNSNHSSSDPYNAGDYWDADDFYYDYYDDFWDYEDAEDYWEDY